MTHPTRTLTATAIAAALAAGVFAGQAAAHEGSVCTNPDGTYTVTRNTDGPIRSISPAGPGLVRFTWSDGYTAIMPVTGPCATPAPPPPAPEPSPAPAGVEPQPAPATTCADLLNRYPAAGPVRRAQWGCPAEPVKRRTVKPPPPPRRVVTCSFVVSHYRGVARARMVARYGLPATCGRSFNPPVAG